MVFVGQPEKSAYDFDDGRVNFYAEHNGSPVKCAVSEEAIQDLTQSLTSDGEELLEPFRSNQNIFVAIAEEKFLAGNVESDGYVVVKSADLAR